MLDSPCWDTALLRRYDIAGPRYTSYPTAVQFHPGISAFDVNKALRESRQAQRSLSLYVHIPFCANICYYCACNKVITKDRGQGDAYLQRLFREIDRVACHLDMAQPVEQLHFGGGTPTFLSPRQLRELMDHLRQRFNLADDDSGDYSIELDPREADWASMGLLRELGFNRVSLGVQDFDPQVQAAINRRQSLEETQALVEAARTLQFRSLNLDLIYGLPKQTPEHFARTVATAIELLPDRLSVFAYAHLPQRFPPQRRIAAEDLPSAQVRLEMLQRTIEQLTTAGYRYIGMDHFALEDDSLAIAQDNGELQRNFQGYTTHGHCDLLGFGVSAISRVGDLQYQNYSTLSDYNARLDNDQLAVARGWRSGVEDQLRQQIIQRLMCDCRLDFASIERNFAIEFARHFAALWPALRQLAADGLLVLGDDGIEVTPRGRLLVRHVCMLFDEYLQPDSTPKYSRII